MYYWLYTTAYETLSRLICLLPLVCLLPSLPLFTAWWMGADIRRRRDQAQPGSWPLRITTHLGISLALTALYLTLTHSVALITGYSRSYEGSLKLLLGAVPPTLNEQRLLMAAFSHLGLLLTANGMLHQALQPAGGLRAFLDNFNNPNTRRGELGSAHFCAPAEYKRYRVPDLDKHGMEQGLTFYGAFWGDRQRRLDAGQGRFCLNGEDAARGVLTIGGPGSGKTAAVILPAIADHMESGHSLIVADPQGELKSNIAELACVTHHLLIIHDPTSSAGPRFNLAQQISNVADARAIAGVLIPDPGGGDNKFWSDSATALLAACLLCFNNLGEIHAALGNVAQLAKTIQARSADATRLAGAFIASATSQEPRVATSIIATLATALTGWADPEVCANTSASDFDASLLCERPTVVVLTCPGRMREVYASYLGATLTKLLQDLDTIGEQHGGALPLPVGLILDEFPTLGRLNRLVADVNLVRKRRISIMVAAQTKGQFHLIYGQDGTQALFAGLATQIIFGGCDDETADFYSKASGTTTQVEPSKNGGNATLRSRPLLTTDEVKAPVRGNCTLFARYVEPGYSTQIVLTARLTRLYERRDWEARRAAVKGHQPFTLQRGLEFHATVVSPPTPNFTPKSETPSITLAYDTTTTPPPPPALPTGYPFTSMGDLSRQLSARDSLRLRERVEQI